MPMTAAGMAAAIQSGIEAQLGTPANAAQLEKFCTGIATGIVTYIQANAEVIVTEVTGVTPGPGVSGPGTGTIE